MPVCKIEIFVQYDEDAAEENGFDNALDSYLGEFVEQINDLPYARIIQSNIF